MPRGNRTTPPPHRIACLCGLAAVLALGGAAAGAETDDAWSLRKQDEALGIDVYQRDTAEGHREFLAVTHVQSRLSAFVALFRDVESMPKWMHRVEEVRVLEQVSPTESITYTIYDMPWPFNDRDSVLRVTLEQDPESLTVRLRARAEPGHPPAEDRIRMRTVESLWEFAPLPGGETQVRFRAYADPGGKLSSGLIGVIQNKLIWQSPLKTLRRLHEVIGEPRYQDAAFEFVQEPLPRTERASVSTSRSGLTGALKK